MFNNNKTPTLEELKKLREQSYFIGREEYLALFHRNLQLSPEDKRYRILFNISGMEGVGKSTLLREFQKLAEDTKFITVKTDEEENNPLKVMESLAEQLERQGYKLAGFSNRYKVYRQKMHELETDPEAPQGWLELIGKTGAKAVLDMGIQTIPGADLIEIFDTDAVAAQAGEFTSYLAKKLTNKDEVILVREPIKVLTPLFLKDISTVAKKSAIKGITLFFDSYERTEKFLDQWLREILIDNKYAQVQSNILFIIAGWEELDKHNWSALENYRLMQRLPLEPFTEDETRYYLASKGISNSQVIDKILNVSNGLPLMLSLSVPKNLDDPNQVIDANDKVVENLLKSVNDSKQQKLVLDAAIPLGFNLDILALLQGEQDATNLFEYLTKLPFVEKRSNAWAYHPIVRNLMLRYKFIESQKSWYELHSKLADYYVEQKNNLQLNEEKGWHQDIWKNYKLNILYHRLCESPHNYLVKAINDFLIALKNKSLIIESWAETIIQAGEDTNDSNIEKWGKKLLTGWKAHQEMKFQHVVDMFTALLENQDFEIDQKLKPIALFWRGKAYMLMKEYQKAETDFNQAITPDDKFSSLIFASRGLNYRLMERYEEALEDFNRVIEINPQNDWVIARRGTTYSKMKLHEKAIEDYSRAIEINPQSALTFLRRGQVYKMINRPSEAERDFAQAKKIQPELDANNSDDGSIMFIY